VGTLTALYCLLLTVVPDRFVGRLLLVPALLALLGTTGVPIGYMLITSVYDVGLTTFQHPGASPDWRTTST
jgi:tellurite resistance protein TehA-like permease